MVTSFIAVHLYFNFLLPIMLSEHFTIMGSGCGSVAEGSLPIPEVSGSTPVIRKIYIEHFYTCLLSPVTKRRK